MTEVLQKESGTEPSSQDWEDLITGMLENLGPMLIGDRPKARIHWRVECNDALLRLYGHVLDPSDDCKCPHAAGAISEMSLDLFHTCKRDMEHLIDLVMLMCEVVRGRLIAVFYEELMQEKGL